VAPKPGQSEVDHGLSKDAQSSGLSSLPGVQQIPVEEVEAASAAGLLRLPAGRKDYWKTM
jgi:hypothetical protein